MAGRPRPGSIHTPALILICLLTPPLVSLALAGAVVAVRVVTLVIPTLRSLTLALGCLAALARVRVIVWVIK